MASHCCHSKEGCNNGLKNQQNICYTNYNDINNSIGAQATKKDVVKNFNYDSKKKEKNTYNNSNSINDNNTDVKTQRKKTFNNKTNINYDINSNTREVQKAKNEKLDTLTFNNKLEINFGMNDNVSRLQEETMNKDFRKLTFNRSAQLVEQEMKSDNMRTRSRNNYYQEHRYPQKCNIHRGHQTLQHRFDVFCLTCYRESVSKVNASRSVMEQQQCAITSGNDLLRASEWI